MRHQSLVGLCRCRRWYHCVYVRRLVAFYPRAARVTLEARGREVLHTATHKRRSVRSSQQTSAEETGRGHGRGFRSDTKKYVSTALRMATHMWLVRALVPARERTRRSMEASPRKRECRITPRQTLDREARRASANETGPRSRVTYDVSYRRARADADATADTCIIHPSNSSAVALNRGLSDIGRRTHTMHGIWPASR